jgi:hypothetical protein
MKAWRCDLTALSYVHNLYFVACNDTIRVYQPGFPDQTFGFESCLILHPPISSPYLSPYMDEDDPHSITRVLVAYLGNDEVLLVTCDDGDVVGYRVSEIQRVISTPLQNDEEVEARTFLHRNVGQSAWGLAVHREARMIAISANTHEITVLAYALADQDDEGEFSKYDQNNEKKFPKPRTRDHVITLRANHNVPAVSFNNTSSDPQGRWLFSTCINGEVRLWDLHNPSEPSTTFQMGWCFSAQVLRRAPNIRLGECRCENRRSFPHGTWGAMWLDEKAAYEIGEEYETREEVDGASFFEDAERQKERFREKRSAGDDDDNRTTEDYMEGGDDMELSDFDSDYGSGIINNGDVAPDMEDEHMSLGSDPRTNEDDELDDASDSDEEEDEEDEQDEENEENAQPTTYTGPSLPSMHTSTHEPPAFQHAWQTIMHAMQVNALANPHAHDTETSNEVVEGIHFISSLPHSFNIAAIHPPPRPKPYCEITSTPSSWTTHQQSTLMISQDAIFLRSPDCATPILTLRSPLGAEYANMRSHRLCFSQYILELGCFIVASPVGGAGIFAVTKSLPTPTSSSKSGQNVQREGNWKFGFRLEHILPSGGWNARLVGVAVGPVQGMFDAEGREWGWGERRWRVLMYYTDHSVRAFEVSRKREGGSGVGELVV